MAEQVPSDIGVISGEVEATYGVDPVPDRVVQTASRPDEKHNDTFETPERYGLTRNTALGARVHVDQSLTVAAIITKMEDAVGGFGDHHPAFIAAGLAVTGNGLATGTGNFITYGPQSSGFGSATFYAYDKDDSGDLSLTKHKGTRGDGELVIDPQVPNVFNLNGKSLHDFPAPFSALTAPTDSGLDDVDGKCFTMTLDANVIPIERATLKLNNETVTSTPDIRTCNAGVDEIEIKNGTPVMELRIKCTDVLIDGVGTDDFIKQSHDADVDFAFLLRSDHDGQRFQISGPKMRFQDMQKEPGDGDYMVWVVQAPLQDDSGDDSFEIRQEVL